MFLQHWLHTVLPLFLLYFAMNEHTYIDPIQCCFFFYCTYFAVNVNTRCIQCCHFFTLYCSECTPLTPHSVATFLLYFFSECLQHWPHTVLPLFLLHFAMNDNIDPIQCCHFSILCCSECLQHWPHTVLPLFLLYFSVLTFRTTTSASKWSERCTLSKKRGRINSRRF